MKAFALAVSLLFGQSRTVVIDTPDVDARATAAWVNVLPDAGCTLTPLFSGPVGDGGLMPQGSAHSFNGARCATVTNAIQRAGYLDVGVGDGGSP
jgi:hypothetical protein